MLIYNNILCLLLLYRNNKTLFIVLDVNTATFLAKWKSQGNETGEGGEAPQYLSIVSNHCMYFHFPTRL